MTLNIETLSQPTKAFEDLVDTHVAFCDATAPAESCHRLPIDALFTSDVTVWTALEDGKLVAMGALKELSGTDGEIKSMHTLPLARGKGLARRLLDTIVTEATERNYKALWLETGVHPDFAAARTLYETAGFVSCPPFGDYVLDPHSVFMTKALEAQK